MFDGKPLVPEIERLLQSQRAKAGIRDQKKTNKKKLPISPGATVSWNPKDVWHYGEWAVIVDEAGEWDVQMLEKFQGTWEPPKDPLDEWIDEFNREWKSDEEVRKG